MLHIIIPELTCESFPCLRAYDLEGIMLATVHELNQTDQCRLTPLRIGYNLSEILSCDSA